MDEKRFIKAVLLHLSHNMWCEWPADPSEDARLGSKAPDRTLTLNEDIWKRSVDLAAAKGMYLDSSVIAHPDRRMIDSIL